MLKNTFRLAGRLTVAACLMTGASFAVAAGEDEPGAAAAAGNTATAGSRYSAEDIEALKRMLLDQQRQINELRKLLEQRQGGPAVAAAPVATPAPAPTATEKSKGLGQVATTAPIVPAGPPPIAAAVPQDKGSASDSAPLQLKLGNTYITPIGFFDLIGVYRDKDPGSGVGTSFGSTPYASTGASNGNLSEFRLSQQNSRFGVRFDTMFKGTKVLGYMESDFLGNNSTNAAVSNGAVTFRLRVAYVDLIKDKFEFLAGQTWSLMTPNRKGVSPLPGDLFFSQVLDVNYVNGLVWGRIPEVRFAYHPTKEIAVAFALSNPEQYLGGSGGGPSPILPSVLGGALGGEFNTGATNFSTPNLSPDFIAKIAVDPNSRFHLEAAGVARNFKTYNTNTGQRFTKTGGGFSLNANFEILKGVRLISNNFVSDGGGRYIFGQAPDVILRPDGDIGLVHANSTLNGAEMTFGSTLFYGYYGLVWIGQNTVIDTTGKPVGYGFAGSPNSQNRTSEEITFGFNRTVWKDAKYGAFNVGGQYAYTTRNPWYVGVGAPDASNMNQIYFNIRYTLPGAAPVIK